MKILQRLIIPTNMSWGKIITVALFSISLLCSQSSWGDESLGPPCTPGGEIRAATVYEHSPQRGASFIVVLTNWHGDFIGTANLPGHSDGHGGTEATLFVPGSVGACDAWNLTIPGPPNGVGPGGVGGSARAKLWIETIYRNPITGAYYLGSDSNAIYAAVGPYVMVMIPDLYADTNHDGKIGAGDLLYSLVDLSDYLKAVPTFYFGEKFNIVDGKVSSLPGMYFSSTDFVLNLGPPNLDPSDNGPFDWTPVTTTGVVGSVHGLEAVPEPSSIVLLGTGLAGLGFSAASAVPPAAISKANGLTADSDSPDRRGRRRMATIVRMPHPSWFCLDGDFGFMSWCARRGGRE
jgi:hypothetical protein